MIALVIFLVVTIGLGIDLFRKIPSEVMPEMRALIAFMIMDIIEIGFLVLVIKVLSGKISTNKVIDVVAESVEKVIPPLSS